MASLVFTNCQAQVFRPEELHTLQTDVDTEESERLPPSLPHLPTYTPTLTHKCLQGEALYDFFNFAPLGPVYELLV